MSKTLSGFTANLFGSGGLKFGGGAIFSDDEPSDEALTANLLVRREKGEKIGAWTRFRAPAMAVCGGQSRIGFGLLGFCGVGNGTNGFELLLAG